MKYYFKLQFTLFRRQLAQWGFSIVSAFCLLLVFMLLLFFIARQFADYADYGLLYLGFSILMLLNISERNSFLKALFPDNLQLFSLRLIENSMLLIPVLLIGVVLKLWLSLAILLFLLLLFSCGLGAMRKQGSMPTPFRKYPFEFIILFRRFWGLFALLYALGIIAFYVQNFNLFAVVAGLGCLLSLQAYSLMEPRDLLWNYNMKPKAFLWHKVRRACLQLGLLISPFLCGLLYMHTKGLLLIMGAYLFVCLLLSLLIYVKYALYPRPTGIGEGILIGCSLVFPLLFLAIFPYYYRRAVRNLKAEIV